MNESDKKSVGKIIGIYCKSKHGSKNNLCNTCQEVVDYAHIRLENCTYGESKPGCDKCHIHCYKPEMRERIKIIMRYGGPRLILHHPVIAVKHLIRRFTRKSPVGKAQ